MLEPTILTTLEGNTLEPTILTTLEGNTLTITPPTLSFRTNCLTKGKEFGEG